MKKQWILIELMKVTVDVYIEDDTEDKESLNTKEADLSCVTFIYLE